MELLTRSVVSGWRLHWTQAPLTHMYSHMLVQQSGACECACAVTTSKRPFIDMRFHVSAILHWMCKWLATVRTSQVLSAIHSITVMYFKLFAVCKSFEALITSPSEIIRWVKACGRSGLLFVSIASSSIRGRSSIFCQHRVVLLGFSWITRLGPPQRRPAPLSWRMVCKISPSRWFSCFVFVGSCTRSFLGDEIPGGMHTCWQTGNSLYVALSAIRSSIQIGAFVPRDLTSKR